MTPGESTAKTLTECVRYMRRHRGKTFVIKIGGALVQDKAALASLASDVSTLVGFGVRACIVHGGGPQATELASRLGIVTEMIDGRRRTDANVLEVAKMVFAGSISQDLLGALRAEELHAVGLSGVSGGLIVATRRKPKPGQPDMGYVGDIGKRRGVNTDVLELLLGRGYIPVVASLGADRKGNVLNINADTVATRIAVALKADKLLEMTNVNGILRDPKDPKSHISRLTVPEVEAAIRDGTISGGMIPKARAAVAALEGGVNRVHILNGHRPHTLLLEVLTSRGDGTLILRAARKRKAAPAE